MSRPAAKRAAALALGALVGAAALAFPLASASAAPPAEQTVYEYLEDRPRQYSTYLALAERAGITRFLKAPKDRTWIIPTNAAFRQVADHRLRSLRSRANRQQLARELMTGVLEGDRSPAQLRRGIGQRIRSIFGSPARISAGEGNLELNHGAKISRTGTRVDNGVVYATNTALLKPDRSRTAGFVAEGTADSPSIKCADVKDDSGAIEALRCTPSAASGDYIVDLVDVVNAANAKLGSDVAGNKTMLWMVGVGGGGALGVDWGAGTLWTGGSGGNGGSGALYTSVNTLRSAYGSSAVHYYVGEGGAIQTSQGRGGGGGASTLVTTEAPPDPVNWTPPPLADVLVIGGSGAGGGAAGSEHSGGFGGSGGVAVSGSSPATGAGGNGSGGNQSTGGRGGNNGAGGAAVTGSGCGSPNWCQGHGGIGGFGAPHTISGTAADGAGWVNQAFYSTENIDNNSVNYRLTPGSGGISQGSGRNCERGSSTDDQNCGGSGGSGYGGGSAGQAQDNNARNGGGGGGGGSFAQAGTCEPPSAAADTPPGVKAVINETPGVFEVIVMVNESGATTCT